MPPTNRRAQPIGGRRASGRPPATGRRGSPPPAHAVDPDAERAALVEAAGALGVALDEAQFERLLAYLALLRRWNAVYNLTAIEDPAAMLVQHLFDCLAIVPVLRAAPAADGGPSRDLLADGAVVLDVGAGGGLPGVVLAICAPGARVYCVDAVGKKAAFVTQVRADLGLSNLHALHARVETLRVSEDLPPPTLIVSRAFASLGRFVALTRHLLAPAGTWAAMKGQLPADELDALPEPVRVTATITLAVPRLVAQRHLLLMAA